MPRKRFNGEQAALALRQAEAGTGIGEACRKMGVSVMRCLKQFVEANAKVTRLVPT